MDPNAYDQFVGLTKAGHRKEAAASLRQFLDSFCDFSERAEWTRKFLATSKFGLRIRHELFQEVIFPVLLDGYRKNDAWSMYWLAGTVKNLVSTPALRHYYKEFGGTINLLKATIALENTEPNRDALLQELLKHFDYAGHEWPSGILSGTNGATSVECYAYLDDIRLARELDGCQNYVNKLDVFEARVRIYLARILAIDERQR
jgi:hypothetical protein